MRTISIQVATPSIRAEGDSYIAGACGIPGIGQTVGLISGRAAESTARGASTLDEAMARVLAPENQHLLNYVTVFWDGSQNGFTNIAEYADQMASMINALGHDRFVVLPAVVPAGQSNAEQAPAIRDEFKARWPENFLDWRDFLTVDEFGALTPDQLCDSIHLNEQSLVAAAENIAGFIQKKGW